MKNNKIENLKKQWKNEIYLSLFDEFEEVEYHGYNNIKPLFDEGYVMTFNISDKLQIELKNKNLKYATEQYSDEWCLVGDYDNNILIDKYNKIWNTEIFLELRRFIVEFYEDLCYEVTKFINFYECEEENYIDNYIIKEFINNYLNEKFN